MDKTAVIVLCMSFLLFRCTGSRPAGLGAAEGKPAPCPDTPNCVSSQEKEGSHFIEPLRYTGDMAAAKERLLSVIGTMKRAKIIKSEEWYIYAEFTSAVFRFVDDVEFYFDDAAKKIDVRSASRLGRSDLGVNRKRVEEVRKRFEVKGKAS